MDPFDLFFSVVFSCFKTSFHILQFFRRMLQVQKCFVNLEKLHMTFLSACGGE